VTDLELVTITGADDHVDPNALVELSLLFPFVEWAILASASRVGSHRYPTQEWIGELLAAAQKVPMRLAVHLCGSRSRAFRAGAFEDALAELPVGPRAFQRVQVNGWDVGDRCGPGIDFDVILQVRSEDQMNETAGRLDFGDRMGLQGIALLFDPSGGRGKASTKWPIPPPGVKVGYAGGLGPSNLVGPMRDILIARMAAKAAYGERVQPYWLDMESGVRDGEDNFDLWRVRNVLEIARSAADSV